MNDVNPKCIVCNKDVNDVPLLPFQFHQQALWICPQHLPILIHKPEQLADLLPGFKAGPPAEH